MKNNNFRLKYEEFIRNLSKVRGLMGLECNIKKISEFVYQSKLGDNSELEKVLLSNLQTIGKRVLLIADTNSGKTYTILKTFNSIKNDEDTIHIKVILTPKRVQNTQNQTMYSDLFKTVAIVGGTSIDIDKLIEEEFALSIVYDRMNILPKLKSEIEEKTNKQVVFSIVIDETHDLIKDYYRNTKANPCLDRIRETLEELRSCSSVTYMTGTFENCYTLDFNEIVFCEKEVENDPIVLRRFTCPKTMAFEKFTLNRVNDVLTQGKKVLIMVNSFDTIEELETTLKKEGYKVANLTSKSKTEYKTIAGIEYKSKEYAQIVNGIFPNVDCLICTSILTEGSSITRFAGEEKEIVPIFCYDINSYSMLDAKQFYSRLRMGAKELHFIEVASMEMKDEYEVEETLLEILEKEMKVYLNSYKGFQQLLEATKTIATDVTTGEIDWEAVDKMIINVLNQQTFHNRKSDLSKVIRYINHEIFFDVNKCMNDIYNKYERQFLDLTFVKKLRMERMFNCIVEDVIDTSNELEILDNKKIAFEIEMCNIRKSLEKMATDDFCEAIVELEESTSRITKIGSKESEIFASLLAYRDTEQIVKAFETDTQELLLEQCVIDEIKTLSKNEVATIEDRINEQECELDEVANRVVKSSCYETIKKGVRSGLKVNEVVALFKKYDSNEKVNVYIREQQIIDNNKAFEKGNLMPGIAANEQYVVLREIDKVRGDKKVFTISDDLVSSLNQKLTKITGQKWTTLGVRRFIKEVYVFNEEKEKTYYTDEKGKRHSKTTTTLRIKGIRKQHSI